MGTNLSLRRLLSLQSVGSRARGLQQLWGFAAALPGREDPLEKEMATHSSILAWKIPWMQELVGYSPWGRKESDRTERLHSLTHSCPSFSMWDLAGSGIQPVSPALRWILHHWTTREAPETFFQVASWWCHLRPQIQPYLKPVPPRLFCHLN